MTRVLLVTMPFGSCLSPSLGLGLLRQEIRHKGFACDVRYLNLPYAASIGVELYSYLANSFPTILLGEWLFAHLLFDDQRGLRKNQDGGSRLPAPEMYVEEILREYVAQHGRAIPQWVLDSLPGLRRLNEAYLDDCLASILWESYDVIGFTSTFEQNLAALALAQRIKERWPEKIIVFGGANWEGEMGLELMRQFPFVDYACSGEADWLFPELVNWLAGGAKGGKPAPYMVGLFHRDGDAVGVVGRHALGISDMDSLPFVEYDDYFEQLAESGLAVNMEHISLLAETSRGCWWGAHSQCTFCGLNGSTMGYRSKSGGRVLEEFRYLAQRYPQARNVFVVDNILDMGYFSDVLPALAQEKLGLSLTYEVKANLKKDQMRLLKAAGVNHIQPGIESLDSELLHLMKKGVSGAQNIQLLKWARQYDIDLSWNMLAGFPGASPAAYERMTALLPALTHLQPPSSAGVSWLRLDRFSPYFENPEAYGVSNVRPVEAYRYIYPFDDESLGRIAYYFDFDDASRRATRPAVEGLHQAVDDWHKRLDASGQARPSLNALHRNGKLTLYDSRPGAQQTEYVLTGLEQQIYEFCEEGRSLAAIQRHVGDTVETQHLASLLDGLVARGLMLGPSTPGFADNRYLSLAVDIDERAGALASELFASLFTGS